MRAGEPALDVASALWSCGGPAGYPSRRPDAAAAAAAAAAARASPLLWGHAREAVGPSGGQLAPERALPPGSPAAAQQQPLLQDAGSLVPASDSVVALPEEGSGPGACACGAASCLAHPGRQPAVPLSFMPVGEAGQLGAAAVSQAATTEDTGSTGAGGPSSGGVGPDSRDSGASVTVNAGSDLIESQQRQRFVELAQAFAAGAAAHAGHGGLGPSRWSAADVAACLLRVGEAHPGTAAQLLAPPYRAIRAAEQLPGGLEWEEPMPGVEELFGPDDGWLAGPPGRPLVSPASSAPPRQLRTPSIPGQHRRSALAAGAGCIRSCT
ncbi:hypothetical protein ABPG77_006918 [Micractinium sp. CCAP 211/92]